MIEILRKGMFETNSSSMHSIIIDNNFPREDNKRLAWDFENYRYGQDDIDTIRVNMSYDHQVSYSRQNGNPLMSPDDKLYFYLVIIAYNILHIHNWDLNVFLKEFKKEVDKLQKDFFDSLNIKLEVTFPKIVKKFNLKSRPYQVIEYLPDIEDSDMVFDSLLDFLKDQKNLYSFLFSPKSFVILGGDEYESAYILNKLIKKGIDYDCTFLGHIGETE